jgi:hypothetical protein
MVCGWACRAVWWHGRATTRAAPTRHGGACYTRITCHTYQAHHAPIRHHVRAAQKNVSGRGGPGGLHGRFLGPMSCGGARRAARRTASCIVGVVWRGGGGPCGRPSVPPDRPWSPSAPLHPKNLLVRTAGDVLLLPCKNLTHTRRTYKI